MRSTGPSEPGGPTGPDAAPRRLDAPSRHRPAAPTPSDAGALTGHDGPLPRPPTGLSVLPCKEHECYYRQRE